MINRFLLISVFAALLLPSCVTENEVCPSAGPAEEFILNLNITAGNIFTRAEQEDHKMDYKASEADNYINPEDLCVYILNSNGTVIDKFEPTSKQLTIEGLRIRGLFAPKSDKFRIMALANWQTRFGGNYETNISESTTLTGLYADANNFNFTMPAGEGGASWIPDAIRGSIPMFGLSVEDIEVPDRKGHFVPELDVKSIPMLRALAKIEVINNTNDKDIKITAVRLTDYVPTGRFIPDGSEGKNEDWNIGNIQVTEPSLPFAAATKGEALRFAAGKGEIFTAYIPEIDLNGLGDKRPHLEIDISINNDTPVTFPVKFGKYEGGKCVDETYLAALLRNHRYEFSINSVGSEIDLKLIIDTKWSVSEESWDYEDATVQWAQNGKFDWTEESKKYNEESPDGSLRTLLVTTERGAEAAFEIENPRNSIWTLSLITDANTPNNAFRIDVWDDDSGDWLEGTDSVTGNTNDGEVKIRIIATDVNETSNYYSARLIMSVTTFDERTAPVVLPDNSDYYIIKQYQNL